MSIPARLGLAACILSLAVATFSEAADENPILTTPDNPLAPLPGDSESAIFIFNELDRISSETGRAPSLAEFRSLLLDESCSLVSYEYLRILSKFIASQKPTLQLDSIRRVRNALRDSIHAFEAEWELSRPSPNVPEYQAGKYRFAMDANKLLYEAKNGKTPGDLVATYARAFDGKSETVYNANALSQQAIVHDLVSGSYYFEWHNPLWLAKLIDSKKFLNKSTSGLENFDNREAYPLEETIDFNGRRCIVLLEQEDTYFLDPSMNYAYCGLEAGRYEYDEQLGRLVESSTYRSVVLDDFQDCGDSLWMPRKFVDTRFSDTAPTAISKVRVTKLRVNEPIDDEYFSNVVPAGVEVVNGLDGKVRVYGLGSVEESLDSAIKPRQWTSIRTIALLLNVAVVSFLVYLVFIRHKKRLI